MTCLFGRDVEIALLTSHLDETEAGRGGVVLFSGEPAFGKSALLDEVRVHAHDRGFAVIPVRCFPGCLPQADPPSNRIIRNLCALASQTAGNRQCGSNVSIIPALPHTVTEVTLMEARRVSSNPSTTEICASYRTLRQLFEMTSRERALLLTLDDVHNADEQLFALLRFAAHEFCNLRVLLVAAFCPIYGGAGARTIIEEVGKDCRLVELTPFDRRATGEVVAQIAGTTPHEWAIYRIQELTGGNPGLVIEAALYNARKEHWVSALDFHPQVPATILAIVEKKLAPLSKEARALLRVASVIGETFTGKLLLELIAPSEGAHAALSESRAQGLLHRVDGDRYRFAMGFARKVLYQDLALAERGSLHRQIAAILETEKHQNFEAVAGDVALHLLASQEPNAIGRAIRLAELSAAHSARFGDYHGAVVMYSIALEAIALSRGSEDARRCDLLIELAKSQNAVNDLAEAQESLHQAAEIAQRLDDWPRLAEIVLTAPVLNWPPPGTPNGLVIMLAERLLDSQAPTPTSQRALVMARLAAELAHLRGESDRSRQMMAEALKINEGLETGHALLHKLLGLRDHVLSRPEAIEERVNNSTRVIRLARQHGDWISLFKGEWAREISLLQLGALDRADAGRQTLEHVAIMAGPKYRCVALAFKGILALFEGRFSEGEEMLDACRKMAEECGATEQIDHLWTALIMPLDEQERVTELEAPAALCFRMHPNSTLVTAMWSWLALKLGKSSEARFHLSRLSGENFRDLRDPSALLAEAAVLTEVCTEFGDLPQYAAMLYDILLPYANRNAVCDTGAAFGAVSRYLGKLALNLSRVDEAIAHLRAALEFNNTMGARAWAAYASYDLALALMARGNATDQWAAFELLTNSHAEAVGMGMRRLAKSTGICLDHLGIVKGDSCVTKNRFDESIVCAPAENCAMAASTAVNPPQEAAPASSASPEAVMVRAGLEEKRREVFSYEKNNWTIVYGEKGIRLKRLKGLNLIAYLLSRPYQEVHALELAGIAGLEAGESSNGVDCAPESCDLGPVLDNSAKQSYRNRIHELREDLEEARSFNDFERAGKLEEELCIITRELARAFGLGGRDRRPGSQTERARLRVTSAIRWAISRISKQHSALGHFLAITIKTGTYCSYIPDPKQSTDWDVRM
jgi:tetratricopeptide (TPR) repeat protein